MRQLEIKKDKEIPKERYASPKEKKIDNVRSVIIVY